MTKYRHPGFHRRRYGVDYKKELDARAKEFQAAVDRLKVHPVSISEETLQRLRPRLADHSPESLRQVWQEIPGIPAPSNRPDSSRPAGAIASQSPAPAQDQGKAQP